MTSPTIRRGSFTLPNTSRALNRIGYGAMQPAGRDGNKLYGDSPETSMEPLPFRGRLSQAASTTLIRPTFTVRMSPTGSSERHLLSIRMS